MEIIIRQDEISQRVRELAEEIGLREKTDCAIFHKVLEMNVIAPGLIDAKCSEDTHAWGQEGKINDISLVFYMHTY